MAGYGYPRILDAGLSVHRHAGTATGTQGGVSGGNRVSQGLHRWPATASPSRNDAEQRLWTIPVSGSGRRTALVNVIKTPLPGVLILEPQVFSDKRGSFMEIFH